MQNKFSIGEMSRLMDTPVKTLRYYDEIGLFKPNEVNAANGYRYYATEQFEQLDIIKYLRLLGVPLAEIKAHFTQRRVEYFLQLLKKQEGAIQEKIRNLESIRRKFGSRIQELQEALTVVKTGMAEIKHFPARHILRLQETVESGPSLELSVRKLDKLIGAAHSHIFIGKVGLMVSEENMHQGRFQEYSSVFIVLEDSAEATDLMTVELPAGEYASIFFHGGHGDSPEYYRRLLEYVYQQGCSISGESIERTIVDEFISKDKEKFLTEIHIPVRRVAL